MGMSVGAWFFLAEMKKQGFMRDKNGCDFRSVIELGSQDLGDNIEACEKRLRDISGDANFTLTHVAAGYAALGICDYQCIDADGRNGAIVFDLNRSIKSEYGFNKEFDLVTNFGTAEHCFNQYEVFRNMHDLCRAGGVLIGFYPTQGCINHGYFHYTPKLLLELALANRYEILGLYVQSDKSGFSHYYSPEFVNTERDGDLFFVTVFRQSEDKAEFLMPFDGAWLQSSLLKGYAQSAGLFGSMGTLTAPVWNGDGFSDWDEAMFADGIKYSASKDLILDSSLGYREIPQEILLHEDALVDDARFWLFRRKGFHLLIVVDKAGRYVGVITRGDVERHERERACERETCGGICNRNGVTIDIDALDSAFSKLRGSIKQIPVLDRERRPVLLYGIHGLV
ncbi:MAG: CBS domain-containing protein [Synergistaceae bacterium]|jgi:CBS domain-containing protein|nr:CBS domain-containing protein [Synergistaceae bacterium]